MRRLLAAPALAAVVAAALAGRPALAATEIAGVVIVAAGDIACDPADPGYGGGFGTSGACRMRATSNRALAAGAEAVLPLGDEQYPDGALSDFQASYGPTWGRLLSTSHPVPGNHEYRTPDAAGYYDYFGAAAGDRTQGYYSYDVGDWHLIALNSNCGFVGGCAADSPQVTWLRQDLLLHPNLCTLAYWHHPRFASGQTNGERVPELWKALHDAHADVILNGHRHHYERFAPLAPDGARDRDHGIREFVVGTGGVNLVDIGPVAPNSKIHDTETFGVLKLTLGATGYTWEFVHAAGGTFRDSGFANCR